MLRLISDFQKKRKTKKLLLALFDEVNKNLEKCYVMQQRNVLDRFVLDVWKDVCEDTDIELMEHVSSYGKIFQDYNDTMDDFKEYEKWYASDIKNKTRDNGIALHEKRQVVSDKFEGLQNIVKLAQRSLRHQLSDMKLINEKLSGKTS